MTEMFTPTDEGLEPQPLPADLSPLALAFQARQVAVILGVVA